jgi:hypothetical protein
MATITTINENDQITDSRTVINANFANLDSDKIETSTLDTDTTFAANSDSKIPTQKAVKAYVDAGGNPDASTIAKGVVEEATTAEIASGLTAGSTGARLFINPSSTTTTSSGAGDEGKIPRLNSSGLLDSSLLSPATIVTVTAGPAISNRQAVYMSVGDQTTNVISTTTGSTESCTGSTWIGQTFTTDSETYSILSVTIRSAAVSGSALGSCYVSIRATSGGLPTGANLTTAVNASYNGNSQDRTFTFGSPLAVTPSTVYAIVMRSDGAGGFVMTSSSSSYASGNMVGSADSGSSWSSIAAKDLYSSYVSLLVAAGQVGLAKDDGTSRETRLIGIANEAIAAGATGDVIIEGYVSGMSGLTAGDLLTLSDTPGSVTTGQTKKIGIALSSTEMILRISNS